ncbi:vWA domain-containing protein [Actinokineospora sp.]|uniref:vWA domain-containing protein n=1 Tax=Actinokineospora sp. TaxID=1872133 RepID=UPI004037621B
MSERVLPFYAACDESYSMADHMDTVNAGLRELRRAVCTDPAVTGTTRFCLIGFAGSAKVLVPLSRLGDVTEMTGLSARAATNFGSAFTLLRDTIERDVATLTAASYQVYQPTVFFLSDGQPTDPALWPAAHARLTDPDWPAHPKIIAFGIGDADAATIGRIGTFKAYMSDSGITPGQAVREFAKALTTSVVASGCDGEQVRVPARISGFSQVDRG